jgi:hypothetical protein
VIIIRKKRLDFKVKNYIIIKSRGEILKNSLRINEGKEEDGKAMKKKVKVK